MPSISTSNSNAIYFIATTRNYDQGMVLVTTYFVLLDSGLQLFVITKALCDKYKFVQYQRYNNQRFQS